MNRVFLAAIAVTTSVSASAVERQKFMDAAEGMTNTIPILFVEAFGCGRTQEAEIIEADFLTLIEPHLANPESASRLIEDEKGRLGLYNKYSAERRAGKCDLKSFEMYRSIATKHLATLRAWSAENR